MVRKWDHYIEKHRKVFERIASVYNLFFRKQKRGYVNLLQTHWDLIKKYSGGSILDLGCGTGALSAAFMSVGFKVKGVDISHNMIKIAKRNRILCEYGDVSEGLVYSSSSFDGVVGAYFLHGLPHDLRVFILEEARRIARHFVLFYDYNHNAVNNRFVRFIEKLEGSDFINFSKEAEKEFKIYFPEGKKIIVGKYTALYFSQIRKE